MIVAEVKPSELRIKHMQGCLAFLDSQRLIEPRINPQVGFDFQGLRQSYKDNLAHPDAPFIARYGRTWIYDVALSIYADLKAGRIRQAGYQVGRAMQLALQEEAKGFEGLWHFSYNTKEDPFIDPRGPTGANAWCLNAIYSYILATGETSALPWANRSVRKFLFRLQVMDPKDPRYGLARAGMHNPVDLARGDDLMGYRVYEEDPNRIYEHVILEHNADIAGTLRLAFKATRRHLPGEEGFLNELIRRHDLMMRGMRRCFWRGDHFISAIDEHAQPYLGTDGQPSVAIDNNTWASHLFVPYDPDLVRASLAYVTDRFLTRTPHVLIEDLPARSTAQELIGVYYFPASFADPFVQVPMEHRPKMEKMFQLEAAFGLVLFMLDVAKTYRNGSTLEEVRGLAQQLYEDTVILQHLYGPTAAPYASANVPAVFSTLDSVTTAATGLVTSCVIQKEANDNFIGVTPPKEFLLKGKPPLKFD